MPALQLFEREFARQPARPMKRPERPQLARLIRVPFQDLRQRHVDGGVRPALLEQAPGASDVPVARVELQLDQLCAREFGQVYPNPFRVAVGDPVHAPVRPD